MMSDAFRNAEVLLARLDWYAQLDPEDRDIWAGVVAREALTLLANMCGPDLLRRAYESEGAPLATTPELAALSERLWIVSKFFATVEQVGTGSSIVDAAQEAYLVAHGDSPKLFAKVAKKQGERMGSFELALAEMRAIEWSTYFNIQKVGRSESHDRIAAAFGTSWDAISKWKQRLPRTLGTQLYNYRLAVVQRLAEQEIQTGLPLMEGSVEAHGPNIFGREASQNSLARKTSRFVSLELPPLQALIPSLPADEHRHL